MNDRFERQNATISVNVYGYENGDVYLLRVSKHEHETVKPRQGLGKPRQGLGKPRLRLGINPLLIDDGENNTTVSSMRVPFIVYADFESFTQKLDTAQPYPYDSYTKQYQKHTPSGFCYYIKCFDDEVYKMINLKQNPIIYTKQSEDEDHELRFIDSFKFMASSLDKLVGNLQKDQFVNLECGASGINGKYKGKQLSLAHKALLKRKGVYPYDDLAETQLPPKNEFYSKLSGDDISDEDYVHAQQV
ncbi:hypothetical protein MAR_021149 [Mya arenaria]|uniref:Uncharacterized protein n=1 Tax=Mya arenaria TaxID=6604 RepID=A0ABY7E6V9_MYAAR|nr:hypothetical protein MAR_021149 [Mya arenaria]